jgi:DnaD/phage-associated family protein
MNEKPNYYAIIPAHIRYNENLNSSQKLFYGEITALTFKTGECWASNNYFARLYKVSPSVISNWVKALERENLIVVDYETKGKEITKRIIKIVGIQNIDYVFNKNEEGYSKNIKENNTSINNTSIYTTTNSIFDLLQENGFILTPIQYEVVSKWEDTELTRHAIKQAVLNNKFNINYIDKIIYSYKKDNIKSVQEAIEREEEFNKKRDSYYKNKYEQNTKSEREKRIEEWLNSE